MNFFNFRRHFYNILTFLQIYKPVFSNLYKTILQLHSNKSLVFTMRDVITLSLLCSTITCSQMYSGDGSALLYWHGFGGEGGGESTLFTRGITSIGSNTICVGR